MPNIEFKPMPMPCIALRRCICPREWQERGQYDYNCISCRVWVAKTDIRMRSYYESLKEQ